MERTIYFNATTISCLLLNVRVAKQIIEKLITHLVSIPQSQLSFRIAEINTTFTNIAMAIKILPNDLGYICCCANASIPIIGSSKNEGCIENPKKLGRNFSHKEKTNNIAKRNQSFATTEDLPLLFNEIVV